MLASACTIANQHLQRERMARYLGCNPSRPDTWPIRIIDRLLNVELNYGEEAMLCEAHKLMSGQ